MNNSKHKIEGLKIRGYSFTALVDVADLPIGAVEALELKAGVEQVEVEGEFSVEWDDDIPLVRVSYVLARNENGNELTIYDEDLESAVEQYDAYNIEQLIEQDGDSSEWMADAMAMAADRAYDEYYDR